MKIAIHKIMLMLLMVASAATAMYLRPTHKIAADRHNFVLENIIPQKFADWRVDEDAMRAIVNPQQEIAINKLYSQTLSRTYVNSLGERVMLVIAYGEDQSDSNQLHYPEVCYPAQGFQIVNNHLDTLTTSLGEIPVKKLLATLSRRNEPITYWTTIGDKVVLGNRQTKLEKLKYGFDGKIPDGLLFRVSSIDENTEAAFKLQADFINVLLNSVPVESRKQLSGV